MGLNGKISNIDKLEHLELSIGKGGKIADWRKLQIIRGSDDGLDRPPLPLFSPAT